MKNKQIKLLLLLLMTHASSSMIHSARAQCSFTSGSTGADGAFTPTNSMPGTGWSISNNVITVTNKTDGIFNFTSIYVETNWVVKFTKNTLNTPVYLLATTNVTINGTIDVSGSYPTSTTGGVAGPGGFDGGGTDQIGGGPGFGPGGGSRGGNGAGHAFGAYVGESAPGAAYGVIDMLPLIGGSGGGASSGSSSYTTAGGGGGAILIASSATITLSGKVAATGGPQGGGCGCDGSGGAIRLIANVIDGEGTLDAGAGFWASVGRIRLEACQNRRVSLSNPPFTFGPPGAVFLATNPVIQVTSIAGSNTPWPPAGLLTVPDVYLPTNFVNPAVISVVASNVPVGTTFKVILTPVSGTNIVATNTLSGTYTASSNTVSMSVYTDRVWRVNAMIDYIPRP